MDRAEELAKEALPCFRDAACDEASGWQKHHVKCPAFLRPAVAAAIRKAMDEGREELNVHATGYRDTIRDLLARIAKLEAVVEIARPLAHWLYEEGARSHSIRLSKALEALDAEES